MNLPKKTKIYVSVYPSRSSLTTIKEYLYQSAKAGANGVFTSILHLEETNNYDLSLFREIGKITRDLKMDYCLDVNPRIYKIMDWNLSDVDWCQELFVNEIRLDEEYDGKIESLITQNKKHIKLVINASNGPQLLEQMINHKANLKNVVAGYNFYPLKYTGLDYQRFLDLNKIWKKNNLPILTSVALPKNQAHKIGVWKYNDGLPTIEEHRDLSVFNQMRHLQVLNIADNIFIGEQGATIEQIETIKDFQKAKIATFFIKDIDSRVTAVERKILFEEKHQAREDYNSTFKLRSSMPRLTYNKEPISARKPIDKEYLEFGDIVILNENAQRYKGELHVITKRIHFDKQWNYIGKLATKIDQLMVDPILENNWSFRFIDYSASEIS